MSKLSIRDRVPEYLLRKHQLITTVTFAAFFSLVFLLLCIPFSHNVWFALGGHEAFLITLVFCTLSLMLIIASRMGMYALRGSSSFTIGYYILWSAGEILLVSILYTVFTVEGNKAGIIQLEDADVWRLLLSALVYAFISLGIPYILAYMYFTIENQDNTIRLMSFGDVVRDTPLAPSEESRITLFDNNGVLKFSISPDNLYFIESDDNYIQVWYTESSGEMRKYMLRCRLKTVEESFADSDLVRCHRKYIINIRKVRILSADRDGYSIELDSESTPRIPVSKTYEQAVLARFNSRN